MISSAFLGTKKNGLFWRELVVTWMLNLCDLFKIYVYVNFLFFFQTGSFLDHPTYFGGIPSTVGRNWARIEKKSETSVKKGEEPVSTETIWEILKRHMQARIDGNVLDFEEGCLLYSSHQFHWRSECFDGDLTQAVFQLKSRIPCKIKSNIYTQFKNSINMQHS